MSTSSKIPPGYDLGTWKGGVVFKWRDALGQWHMSEVYHRDKVVEAAWAHHEANKN